MSTGEHLWMAANGDGPRDHPLLKDLDLPPLGIPGRAAPLVTGTLLFIGEGSNSIPGIKEGMWGKKFRAYDKLTGEVVWETELSAGTTGSPITYMFEGAAIHRHWHRGSGKPGRMGSTRATVLLFFTLNREDFSFVIHLDRQPRTSRRREAQTGSRARSGSRSERTLDAIEHSRTLMEWWPFLIFHRGGLRIKVINNTVLRDDGRLKRAAGRLPLLAFRGRLEIEAKGEHGLRRERAPRLSKRGGSTVERDPSSDLLRQP